MSQPMNDAISHELNCLLDRQSQAWAAGRRPSVEELLEDSSLPRDAGVLLDLLYNEIVLREKRGERPTVEEYARRYPELTEDLKLHFEVHAALSEGLLEKTQHPQEDALPELDGGLDVGPRLQDYEIVGQLGQGGMAVVYKARHRRLRRTVALKMFQPGRVPAPRELLRFQTEAEAIARLHHPNVVQIFEVGRANGLPYLALELAEGGTLARKLRDLAFTPHAAAALMVTLAGAIQHAHEQHIVHRDLKPANVLFAGDGTPKITDFGLAKMLEEEPADSPRDATRTGEPIGTPRYMAPEQADGRHDLVGPATDVYALGTLLYECLTGRAPFVAATAAQTIQHIRDEEPTSPRRLQPSVPRDLETICLKCLRKEHGKRYASAAALADDLRRFLHHEPILARPTPAWERIWLWCRRRPGRAALVAVALLLALGGAIGAALHEYAERQRLAALREEVATLVSEGQEALARDNNQLAQARFLSALQKVRTEPALREQQLAVAAWYDHTLRVAEKNHWKQRQLPPLFEELRDEALVQCLLLNPSAKKSQENAREALQDALELTIAGDPAWRQERELLHLLDADLLFRAGNPEGALAILERWRSEGSRLWHERQADCLLRLGRKAEADEARQAGSKFPPQTGLAVFLAGIERLQRQDPAGAAAQFEALLAEDPNHFMARFFQAVCFLRQARPTEAKVGLTACLGQRPHFAWTYQLRAEAYRQLHDDAAALRDLQAGLEKKASTAARTALFTSRGRVYLQQEKWAQARADFEQALALTPDAAEALGGLALARGKGP
jgi:tetratricopeptide (TPR) repeat protein/tRNA A-37 threonylcarbamoyl transferase component Bud32